MADNTGIIVIGAARGGLHAVCAIAQALPTDLPVGIAVVLHTSAHSPRILDAIVGSRTALPVLYADHGTPIRAGHIYFALPNCHLVIAGTARFGLEVSPKIHDSRPAVDRLFQTAAAVYGSRVIGVLLAAGSGDGKAGLRAIKEADGMTIVQIQPDMTDELPAALGQNADYCLPIDEIPDLLVTLSQRFGAESPPLARFGGHD